MKRIAICAAAAIVVLAAALTLVWNGAFVNYGAERNVNGALRTVCLAYHAIGTAEKIAAEPEDYRYLTITADAFEQQVRYLSDEGYTFLRASELGGSSAKGVCITFDDGYMNNLQATDILKKYGAVATIFVITDLIGEPGQVTRGAR